MPERTRLGWYGKLPRTGDFIQRQLAEPVVASWANWFQQGLTHWHHHSGASSEEFLRAPVWNFVLPATTGVQRVQMGCLSKHILIPRMLSRMAPICYTWTCWRDCSKN